MNQNWYLRHLKKFFKTSQENCARLKRFKMKSKRPPPNHHRNWRNSRGPPDIKSPKTSLSGHTKYTSKFSPKPLPFSLHKISYYLSHFDIPLNGFGFMNNIKFMKRFPRRYSPTFPRNTFFQKCLKMNLRWQDVTRVIVLEVPRHIKNWDFWRFLKTRDCEEMNCF